MFEIKTAEKEIEKKKNNQNNNFESKFMAGNPEKKEAKAFGIFSRILFIYKTLFFTLQHLPHQAAYWMWQGRKI